MTDYGLFSIFRLGKNPKEDYEMVDEKLYKELKNTVKDIGKRIREKERGVFPELAVTNLFEISKNNKVAAEMILERDIVDGKTFNTIRLVSEEELLKMRRKRWLLFKSNFVPKALLKVIVDGQKVFCTIYNPAVPEWTVKEGLKEFVRLHEGVEKFIIVKNFMDN